MIRRGHRDGPGSAIGLLAAGLLACAIGCDGEASRTGTDRTTGSPSSDGHANASAAGAGAATAVAPARARGDFPRPQVPATTPSAVDPTALDPDVRDRLAALMQAVDGARGNGAAWLALADELLAHGEPAGAASAYAGAMALLADDDAQFERAAYLRAVALNDAGDTSAALEAITPLASSSRSSQVRWRHALLLSADGELEKAIVAARAAVALDPRDMRAHAALAQVASEAGDWTTAEQAARDGLRLNPRNGHLYGILAASLRAQAREREAEALVGAGRFTRADWLDPWLGELRVRRLGQAAAIERFYEALRAADAERARSEIDRMEASAGGAAQDRVPLMRAQLALSINDLATAAAQLERAEANGASPCDVGIVRATIAARQATVPAALDSIAEALTRLACEGDAESTRLELLGNIRLAQQRWTDAAVALVAADRARPGGVGPSLKKAVSVLEKAARYGDALTLAKRLRDAEPLNPEPHLLIAVLSVRNGDLAAAGDAAVELGRVAPQHPALPRLLNEIQRASR